MKVCYTAGQVKKLENCFSVSTNAVEIRIWFLTDDILRILIQSKSPIPPPSHRLFGLQLRPYHILQYLGYKM